MMKRPYLILAAIVVVLIVSLSVLVLLLTRPAPVTPPLPTLAALTSPEVVAQQPSETLLLAPSATPRLPATLPPQNVMSIPSETPILAALVSPTPLPTEAAANIAPQVVQPPAQEVPNVTVLNFAPSASTQERQAYLDSIGAEVLQDLGALNSVVITTTAPVSASPLVAVEPDYYVTALDGYSPTDTRYPEQWGPAAMRLPLDWEQLPADAPTQTIAVIDSGICADHPDLAGQILPGWDFVDHNDNPVDAFGHGCAVAGIIAALHNAEGIAGVAPNARILPLRVLNDQGFGTYSAVAEALIYAADHDVQLVNLSLGGVNPSALLENAVNYALGKGVTIVAAAGNNGAASILYPAQYTGVIAVGAVDPNLQPSSFSNYGPRINAWAPGRNILTTGLNAAFVTLSGTSFAAPHVAGFIALERAFGRIPVFNGTLVLLTQPGDLTPTPPPVLSPTPMPDRDVIQVVMANPSTVYCRNLGYVYSEGADGQGLCQFPNGETCDSWDFLQGLCGQNFSYCAQQGYEVQALDDGQDPLTPIHAVCVNASGEVVGSVVQLANLIEASQSAGCDQAQSFALPPAEDTANSSQSSGASVVFGQSVPAAFDWRDYRGVDWMTSVKNQGGCGSCWAFAAMAVAEGALRIAHDNPTEDINLSEQYLVSGCSNAGSCCGGWYSGALALMASSGIPDEACLPYTDGYGCSCGSSCSSSCDYRTGGQCSDYSCAADRCTDWQSRVQKINGSGWIKAGDRNAMKSTLVSRGPLAVAIGIELQGNYFDTNGIYRCANDATINHAVTVVGYNDAGGYWIIKNSWGTGWPWDYDLNDAGYFKLGYGECGVENWAYYVTVNQTAPGTPVLASPANAALFANGNNLTLEWQASANAYDYQLQISTSSSFTTFIQNVSEINGLQATYTLGDGVYYWRVRAVKRNGYAGAWSAARTFTIDGVPPSVPPLVSPAKGITVAAAQPVFKWNAAAGATRYEIQYGTTNPPTSSTIITTTTFTAPSPLAAGRTYYWRVRAYDVNGNMSDWSPLFDFALTTPTGATVALYYYTTTIVPLTWGKTSWAQGYEVQVDDLKTFASPEFSTNTIPGDTYTVPTSPLANGTYYWRVRAKRANGTWGAWSTIESFLIDAP